MEKTSPAWKRKSSREVDLRASGENEAECMQELLATEGSLCVRRRPKGWCMTTLVLG